MKTLLKMLCLVSFLFSTGYTQTFYKLNDAMKEVSTAQNGLQFAISEMGFVYRLDKDKKWKLILGQLKQISALNPENILGTDNKGEIYKYSEDKKMFTPTGDMANWVSVGTDGTSYKINKEGDLYLKADDWVSQNVKAKKVITINKDLAAALGPLGEYYLKDSKGWLKASGDLEFSDISLSQDGTMAAIDKEGYLHIKTGGAFLEGHWKKTPHKAKRVSVSSKASTFIISEKGELFVSNDFFILDGNFSEFQIRNNESELCLTNVDGRKIELLPCQEDKAQFWKWVEVAPKTFNLISAYDNRCIHSFGDTLGSPIGLWECGYPEKQNLNIADDFTNTIISLKQGCLDVTNKKNQGDHLQLWTECPEGNFQYWNFTNFKFLQTLEQL